MAVFERGRHPVVLGHRGFGRGVVDGHGENTVASFRAAVTAGLDWVEADVRRTRDDRLVVMHFPTTPDERFVVDQTCEEVLAQGGATLEQVLDDLPAEVGVDLDLKTSLEDAVRPADRTTTALLLPVLEAERERRRLLVTSFDPAALLAVRAAVPDVPLGLLTWLHFPLRKAVPAARHLGFEVVAAHWASFARNDVDPAPVHRDSRYSVEVAHRAGLEVLAWCPDAGQSLALAEAGVDALVVNDVPGVLRALTGHGQAPAGQGQAPAEQA